MIFVGPLKTGTTWIYDYLTTVDSVVLPRGTKETFYFDRYYGQGEKFYRQFFEPLPEGCKCVEVSPSYVGSVAALARISRDIDGSKVVLSFRDPVERTLSQYWHELRYGYYSKGLSHYLTENDPIIQLSCYPKLISAAVEIFGHENVSALVFEEMKSDPEMFCKRVCKCVGIDFETPGFDRLLPSNAKRVARNPAASRLASSAADGLKRLGLHSVATFAKNIGLRKLLERKEQDGEHTVSPDSLNRIEELVGFEYEDFINSIQDYLPVVGLQAD